MEIGNKVQLNEEYIGKLQYPWSELAKLRYFEVVSLPDKDGVTKVRRGDLASRRIEHYHESFLEMIG